MKARSTLSIAPYFGGKARMAHFIADRLDYANSDIFVTPFGGMCRVLLNKPRHRVECYNDFDDGLNALMRVLSTPSKASELIHQLYYNTEYSQAEFIRQKAIYDNAKYDLEEQEREKLRKLLIKNGVVTPLMSRNLVNEIITYPIVPKNRNKALHKEKVRRVSQAVKNGRNSLTSIIQSDPDFRKQFQHQYEKVMRLYKMTEQQGYIERTSDIGELVSEMDLAIATYVVYVQSMNGMAKSFSKEKFKDNDQYLKKVLNLYDCADRLAGVHIYQIDAIDYFREFKFVDVGLPDEEIDPEFLMMNEWVNNPRVMMYCDPSYIKPEKEREMLKGIDIDSVSSLSEAIRANCGDKKPTDLGKIYARSFTYDEHEKFLRCIQNARCKIMVSNYDLVLYNKYLNENTGWRKEEFLTTTSVGHKFNSTRKEVIWYNY